MWLNKMHWIDIESKYQDESLLQLPSRLNSLEAGVKDHTENLLES